MSYNLASENGYVQDLASGFTWWKIIRLVNSVAPASELDAFVNSGQSRNPKEVIKDIDVILPKAPKDMKGVLENLKSGLSKCQQIAIVSE